MEKVTVASKNIRMKSGQQLRYYPLIIEYHAHLYQFSQNAFSSINQFAKIKEPDLQMIKTWVIPSLKGRL